jgi:ketosteroid isomerase-like protein
LSNEDVVRAAFDAVNRDDLEAGLALMDPEVEFLPLGSVLVEGKPYRGHEGVREWDRERRALWDLELELHVLREIDDLVLVEGAIRTRGHGSGVELDTPVSWVLQLRDGKIVRIEAFLDAEAARAAAGMAG